MTPEQLAAARARHWRQDAQPLLTLEDASGWLEQMQLALYLPRKAHVLAPAPSFVEAVAGAGSATPAPDAIAQAHALLVRLVAEGSVVPLNLFGTPGEQPDFLVATQALPHLAALQGDRNWKKPPSRTGPGKVSPLAIEIWKLLEQDHGVLTANEIRAQLGHELTEAATIRGLSELWQNLRVAPFPQADGEPAQWQILSVTHKKEMAAGGTMSQSAALSVLVANYLQSIVTGTAEDIEAFLSPVASRSRLRDVIRGLTATRQLRTLSMDAQTFLFIEGTLPEMPELVAASAEDSEAKPAFMGRSAYRERMLNRGKEEEEKPAAEDARDAPRRTPLRTPFRPASDRPAFDRSSAPRRFVAGNRSTSSFRNNRPAAGAERDRPPFRRSVGPSADAGSRPSFSRPRPEGGRSERPFTPRTSNAAGGSRPPYGSRPAFGRKPGFSKPGFSEAGADRSGPPRPSTRRTEGDRPSFKPRSDYGASSGKPGGHGKDRRPSFSDRSSGAKSSDGGARPFRPRPDAFRPRPDGDRSRSGTGRPFTPREGGRPAFSSGSKPYSDRTKPYSDRPRPSFDKSGDASGKNSSRAGFMSRAGGRTGRPTGDRPRPDRAPGDRPSAGRPRPPRADGDRPYAPRPSSGGPRSFTPRPRNSEGGLPPKFDAKPSYPRRDPASPGRRDGLPTSGRDSRPPRREGGSSGYPSNPNRPSRAPRAGGGSFVKRDGASRPASGRPASGRPSSGSGGRPLARGGKSGFSSRPPSRGASSPGRNPGGTGRPSGPRVGGGRPSSGRPGGASRPSSSRPGGMKPPTRKPRPEKDSE